MGTSRQFVVVRYQNQRAGVMFLVQDADSVYRSTLSLQQARDLRVELNTAIAQGEEYEQAVPGNAPKDGSNS